jgi:chromosome partitioning protein
MRDLAIANQKGGVGKTTTAINLGTALAAAGKGVLIFDTDPQGNASTGLDIHPHDRNVTSYDVLVGQLPLAKAVLPTKVPNLYITPGDARLSGVEGELMGEAQPQFFLRNAIEKFRTESTLGIDYILVDCPPSLNVLTVNALTAADGVLVPLQTEYFALEGLAQLVATINAVKVNLNAALEIQGVVLTMYDKRNNLSDQVAGEVRSFFGAKVYQTVIPRNVKLSEAPSFGLPAILYDHKCSGSEAYIMLAQELMQRERERAAA